MGKSSKKGRITGGQRKEINQRAVDAAINDEMEGVVFGRVVKHLGDGHIEIILPNETRGNAKIRNVLAKRGSTPISGGDIVILSGREFETMASQRQRYDVLGVMTRAEAAKLEKAGRIPPWFLNTVDLASVAKKEDADDIFDYSDSNAVAEEADVDIDAI